MPAKVTKITIKRLHGYQNITIPIRNNKIVLVGVNGIGKTTVVNLLYFFLTKQWRRLAEYNFSEISIIIDKTILSITHKNIMLGLEERRPRREPRIPNIWRRKIERHPLFREIIKNREVQPELIYNISRDIGIDPSDTIYTIQRYYGIRTPQLLLFEDKGEAKQSKKQLEDVELALQDKIDGPMLYLPTYRRIEQDLERILPGLEDVIEEYRGRQSWRGGVNVGYLEFVEFGMQDVEKNILKLLNNLKDNARAELSNLTGGYLRDVVRAEADTYEEALINKLDDDSIMKILNRVEEKTLNKADKKNILKAINRIKISDPTSASVGDKYLAHFFSQLHKINESQIDKEVSIRNFIAVCNRYLHLKEIVYDEINYKLSIKGKKSHEITLSMLSSGEKQIVSLFSHLYLSEHPSFFIIIDEPELSLSVEWQKTFLPDILASKKCVFLAAVTHSPFIFENELDDYTVDLEDFIK